MTDESLMLTEKMGDLVVNNEVCFVCVLFTDFHFF